MRSKYQTLYVGFIFAMVLVLALVTKWQVNELSKQRRALTKLLTTTQNMQRQGERLVAKVDELEISSLRFNRRISDLEGRKSDAISVIKTKITKP